MKATRFVVLSTLLVLSGCSGPAAASQKIPAATLDPVPSGYYRIVDIVQHPGLIKCEGESESLMTIISRAGGFTDTDYRRRLKISVVYAGKTRIFSVGKILAGESADPVLPCGATIRQVRRLEQSAF